MNLLLCFANIYVQNLRKVIAEEVYPDMGIQESEVFISDGAQCDIARLQVRATQTQTQPAIQYQFAT